MCPRASNILWILANYLTWRDYSHFPQPAPRGSPCPSSLLLFPQRSGPRWTQIFEWVQMKMSGNYCSSCRAGLQSHDTKLRQQFAAVSCFSRSLCRPLLQFNWIGSGPEEDKTNKVTSRYSLTLWSQVGNLTTASIGIDTTSTQFQTTNVDDLVQLTFCFLLSVTFH